MKWEARSPVAGNTREVSKLKNLVEKRYLKKKRTRAIVSPEKNSN